MSFTTLRYLLFLPLVCLLHWKIPHRFRWMPLLAASWYFYFSWNFQAGLLLLLTTLITWLCAKGAVPESPRRNFCLTLALLSTLGTLGVFKYAGFFAAITGLPLTVRLLLPAGISFYTFQSLSYVLDVYKGRIAPETHFGYYALFVSFFPQLVAGPIERSENLLPQLRTERRLTQTHMVEGCWLLLTGYFRKIVIADGLAPLVDRVYAGPQSAAGPSVILATILFGVQIYCDFSGYSDIARGSAKLFGIELMENFRRPYAARSLREFWRRWHISLTQWFTDYVYIPLGGSRQGRWRQIRNTLIVFLLSGLWHGAGWTYVFWGGLHGIYCVVESQLPRKINSIPLTFTLITFAWLFFRAETIADALTLLSRLPCDWNAFPLTLPETCRAGLSLLCMDALDRAPQKTPLTIFFLLTAVAISWLLILGQNTQNAFIYFQF